MALFGFAVIFVRMLSPKSFHETHYSAPGGVVLNFIGREILTIYVYFVQRRKAREKASVCSLINIDMLSDIIKRNLPGEEDRRQRG